MLQSADAYVPCYVMVSFSVYNGWFDLPVCRHLAADDGPDHDGLGPGCGSSQAES
jgi:hypothetical protein